MWLLNDLIWGIVNNFLPGHILKVILTGLQISNRFAIPKVFGQISVNVFHGFFVIYYFFPLILLFTKFKVCKKRLHIYRVIVNIQQRTTELPACRIQSRKGPFKIFFDNYV